MAFTRAERFYSRMAIVSLALMMGTLAVGAWVVLDNRQTRSTVKTIVQRPQCYALANDQPSSGCERLARLLAQTCIVTPRLCRALVEHAIGNGSASQRRALRRLIDHAINRARKPAKRAPAGGDNGPRPPATHAPAPTASPPTGQAPAPPAAPTTPSTPPTMSVPPITVPPTSLPPLPPLPCVPLVSTRCPQ